MSSSSSFFAALRSAPSGPKNLSAFQLASLWLPVMAMPPDAPSSRIAKETSGLELTPRSITRQPVERRPETTAARKAVLDRRVSRPITTGPPPHHVPKAQAKFTISSGVSASPTTPRTPEVPILSSRRAMVTPLLAVLRHSGRLRRARSPLRRLANSRAGPR